MKQTDKVYDFIVIGSGMGGLTAASLLAKDGHSVLVLEAALAIGGCSSSYFRKGYIFESGATTLIGFDEHQPLKKLEETLGITIPKVKLNPSMRVHLNGKEITRYEDRDEWIRESIRHFGEEKAQELFWEKAFKVADVVWRVSEKNAAFPPQSATDWMKLLKNDPRDVWVLPYAFKSVKEFARDCSITNPEFFRFLDEQLLISAQSKSNDTPFLFGAPAVTYTNCSNYSVPGGLKKMAETLSDFITEKGGKVQTKEKVLSLAKDAGNFKITTSKNRTYQARQVVSGIPVWNMEDITSGKMAEYFKQESAKYSEAWGAFTMGIVTDDVYPDDMPLHHQIHIKNPISGIHSDSIFVSFSHPDDEERSKEGTRVLNISSHTETDYWFSLNGSYDAEKERVEEQVIAVLKEQLPQFDNAEIKLAFSATPVSWENWVNRKKGRVGGIPQSMERSLLDWTPNQTPFKGLYLCGDTVFPGQGIPGVTLSGFHVYYRAQNNF
ncbi:NAD(P)/FAD-dependent oxidoreductase [Rhodohalobacter sp.]|uniref:phytoene desaturase family protein n=1 Tax=Rhodohalobacter sp. TaxID=1974210 RepID=UPI002ACD50C3|nr:NAD(P)/FAD-dependent oxidoreductase [Rhodohalobacter sp.]MDZ7755930.1 NAD(P)/FAD-dependent oxidoreductase [Rhodohalobacter sp.]